MNAPKALLLSVSLCLPLQPLLANDFGLDNESQGLLENYVDSHITYHLSSQGSKQSSSDYNNQISQEKAQQRAAYKQGLYNDTANTVNGWHNASVANSNRLRDKGNSERAAVATANAPKIAAAQQRVITAKIQQIISSQTTAPVDRWTNAGYTGSGRLDANGDGVIDTQETAQEVANSRPAIAAPTPVTTNSAVVRASYADLQSAYMAKRARQNEAANLTDANPDGGMSRSADQVQSDAQSRADEQGNPMPAGWTQQVINR